MLAAVLAGRLRGGGLRRRVRGAVLLADYLRHRLLLALRAHVIAAVGRCRNHDANALLFSAIDEHFELLLTLLGGLLSCDELRTRQIVESPRTDQKLLRGIPGTSGNKNGQQERGGGGAIVERCYHAASTVSTKARRSPPGNR